MPDFDYKSFMAGLQVGRRIRLWDAAANKPPMPPTPSGRYILMEDGTPIMTEFRNPSLIFLSTEEWIDTIGTMQAWSRIRMRMSDEVPRQFFGASRATSSGRYYCYVIISETSFVGKTVYYDKMQINGTVVTQTLGPIEDGYYPSQGGNLYMFVKNLDQGDPVVTVSYSYSYPQDLINVVSRITNSPLITE